MLPPTNTPPPPTAAFTPPVPGFVPIGTQNGSSGQAGAAPRAPRGNVEFSTEAEVNAALAAFYALPPEERTSAAFNAMVLSLPPAKEWVKTERPAGFKHEVTHIEINTLYKLLFTIFQGNYSVHSAQMATGERKTHSTAEMNGVLYLTVELTVQYPTIDGLKRTTTGTVVVSANQQTAIQAGMALAIKQAAKLIAPLFGLLLKGLEHEVGLEIPKEATAASVAKSI